MKIVLFTIGLILTILVTATGQIQNSEKFNYLYEKSDIVVLGELSEQNGFWDKKHDLIYTLNLIKVFSTIKGSHEETLDLITDGGEAENVSQQWTPGFVLAPKQRGYFFLQKTLDTNVKAESFYRLTDYYGFIKMTTKQAVPIPEAFVQSDTIIEFGFDDIQFVSPDQLKFTILARANVNGLYFGKGGINIKYPETVFGTNVTANGGVSVSKGDLINTPSFSILSTDYDEQTFKAYINGGCASTGILSAGIPISTEFQTLLNISLKIQNFNAIGSVSMNEFSMQGSVYHFNPNTQQCLPFDELIVPDPFETGLACVISSFNAPAVLRAGAGDVLTIIGMNFGNSGTIEFPNANDGGATFTSSLPGDILLWKPDTIKVTVPSTPLPAGSGIFRVKTDSGMVCPSPAPLDVCYAVSARRSGGIEERVHVGNPMGGNKLIFIPDSTVWNNLDTRSATIKALCDWNQVSGINWELGTVPSSGLFKKDSINRIFFAPPSSFPIGFAAQTLTTISGCQNNSPPFNTFSYTSDIDLGFRNDLSTLPIPVLGGWEFDRFIPVAANKYDYYGVAIHELGHAHNLRHANPEDKIMWWSSNAGPENRDIDDCASAGAQDVMVESQTMAQSTLCFPISIEALAFCLNPAFEALNIQTLKVFPNPIVDEVNVEIELKSSTNVFIQLDDIVGKHLIVSELNLLNEGLSNIVLKLPQNVPPGLYVLTIKLMDSTYSFKIVKL